MATKKSFDFAKNYEKLEEIVNQLEAGDLSLEDNLKKFEEGFVIANECKEYLKQMENKVMEIKAKFEKD